MIDKVKEIWTLAEVRGKNIHPVSKELLAWGRELADSMGSRLVSVLIGDEISSKSEELIHAGADKVYVIDDPSLENFLCDRQVNILEELINKFSPSILIASATTQGRTVMPMLSGKIGCGLTADCTELSTDPESGRLIQTRPAIGGNVMAGIKTRGRDPQMCTVRPKSKKPLCPDISRKGEITRIYPSSDSFKTALKYLGFVPETSVGLPIQEAEIIISGGKGMKNPKNFAKLKELATLLGGTVGASRMAVDLGWAPYSAQVGLSGKAVTPRIYFAFGISGAVQHIAGMSGAETIIAVNHDPEAPIFRVADLSIQGDAMEILDGLIRSLKESQPE